MKIFVKAKPGAKMAKVERTDDTLFASNKEAHLAIAVRERPVAGRANEAIRKTIARYFNVPPSRVILLSGSASKNKIFEIPNLEGAFNGIMKTMNGKKNKSGQAMLLAVLALGGTMLGATTIAGFLMLYQIRQATDFENSAKAIFAADAGTEWALYSYFKPPQAPLPGTNGTLSNGAMVEISCYDASGTVLATCDTTSSAYAISKGTFGDTKRAFEVDFSVATPTLP
jgi:uncharacterized protein YggU (UPF0235/DUF167 family)